MIFWPASNESSLVEPSNYFIPKSYDIFCLHSLVFTDYDLRIWEGPSLSPTTFHSYLSSSHNHEAFSLSLSLLLALSLSHSVKSSPVGWESDLRFVDCISVSRSRSLCNLRGVGWFGLEDGGDLDVSSSKNSISPARSSIYAWRSIFNKAKPRKNGFDKEKKYNLFESNNGVDFKNVKMGRVLEHGASFDGANRCVFSLK